MASFGRISNSLVSGVSENTVALASINFDFSLVRLEAPKEYSGVGTALAQVRRDSAESGDMHRTARKLGALFEGVIPQAPKVIAAYGSRASQIIQTPGANPTGKSERHGPFSSFVGADATSIWAAATSGETSIAVHLLACLLARAFSDPAQSTSVWAELVQERQREIQRSTQPGSMLNMTQFAAASAASQPIGRSELQLWDASARAWLRTADLAMQKNHIQLKLIRQNISLPVSSGGELYANVIRSWTQAMLGLERLLHGQPQSVTDGGIILAISAWHLYPNLLVLDAKTTNVEFSDPMVPPTALLTVGVTNTREFHVNGDSAPPAEGIYWSVALSHYRFYGRPEEAAGVIDDRVSIDDLYLIAIGSLLGIWKAPRYDEPSLQWFVALWECVKPPKTSLPRLEWLEYLALGAKRVLKAIGQERKELFDLVDFGQRRGHSFLVPPRQQRDCLPWFGLRCPHILDSLSGANPQECGVRYLRHVAAAMGLNFDEAIITQISIHDRGKTKAELHQYTTAVPIPLDWAKPKIAADGGGTDQGAGRVPEQPLLGGRIPSSGKDKLSNGAEPAEKSSTGSAQHHSWEGHFTMYGRPGRRHENPITQLFHSAFSSVKMLKYSIRCDSITASDNSPIGNCRASLPDDLDLFPNRPVQFAKVFGDSFHLRLWIANSAVKNRPIEKGLDDLKRGKHQALADIHSVTNAFSSGQVNTYALWQYLAGPKVHDTDEPEPFIVPFLELIDAERRRNKELVASLRSLAVAKTIYDRLDGATISSGVVEAGIYHAKWAQMYHFHLRLTRSIVFSCIAMFETGKINIEGKRLEEVLGLSSGNSLFVVSRLLNDPNSQEPDYAVTRITGNIGRSGVSLLIPPATRPLVRPLSKSIRATTYAAFNGSREDKFKGTSFHLTFTSHEFPLDYGVIGIRDHQVFFVESVISVHDAGQWVADLDMSRVLNWKMKQRQLPIGACKVHTKEARMAVLDKFTAVDSWEEVLDTPPGIGIVRANENWSARLATSAVLTQPRALEEDGGQDVQEKETENKGRHVNFMILENGADCCWACVYRRVKTREDSSNVSLTYLVI